MSEAEIKYRANRTISIERLHEAVEHFSFSRDASLNERSAEVRELRMPKFIPPEFRHVLSTALNTATKESIDNVPMAMANVLRNLDKEQLESSSNPDSIAGAQMLPPNKCARIEQVIAAMIDEWRLTDEPDQRMENVLHLLDTEVVIDRLVREAADHAARKGEDYVRKCLMAFHRRAELVISQNKRKKTRQTLEFYRDEGTWYLVDESCEGMRRELASAIVVIDAAVAEFGPEVMDNDPSRKVYHVKWNKGIKRGT